MPLMDDLAEEVPQRELERRKFLGLVGSGALAVATVGTGIVFLKYIRPNVLFEAETRFKVGRPENIAPGTVLAFPHQKIFVVRDDRGFFAMSAVCTHLGCMTRYEADRARIFCPCHGSQYALDGTVTQGPAPRPLPRLEVSLEGGVLVVDTRKVVAPDVVLKV